MAASTMFSCEVMAFQSLGGTSLEKWISPDFIPFASAVGSEMIR